jgi:hypothetical protein
MDSSVNKERTTMNKQYRTWLREVIFEVPLAVISGGNGKLLYEAGYRSHEVKPLLKSLHR